MRSIWLVVVLLGLLAQAPPRAHAQASSTGESDIGLVDRVYWLSKLWQEVNYNFAYFDQVPDLDFDAHYRSYIPRVLEARSDFEYCSASSRVWAMGTR
jgi:carboxyl-terminal processing protease